MDVLDRVDQHEGYDPVSHYKLELDDTTLTAQELAARHGRVWEDPSDSETADGTRDVARDWHGAEEARPEGAQATTHAQAQAKAARRLDG